MNRRLLLGVLLMLAAAVAVAAPNQWFVFICQEEETYWYADDQGRTWLFVYVDAVTPPNERGHLDFWVTCGTEEYQLPNHPSVSGASSGRYSMLLPPAFNEWPFPELQVTVELHQGSSHADCGPLRASDTTNVRQR